MSSSVHVVGIHWGVVCLSPLVMPALLPHTSPPLPCLPLVVIIKTSYRGELAVNTHTHITHTHTHTHMCTHTHSHTCVHTHTHTHTHTCLHTHTHTHMCTHTLTHTCVHTHTHTHTHTSHTCRYKCMCLHWVSNLRWQTCTCMQVRTAAT